MTGPTKCGAKKMRKSTELKGLRLWNIKRSSYPNSMTIASAHAYCWFTESNPRSLLQILIVSSGNLQLITFYSSQASIFFHWRLCVFRKLVTPRLVSRHLLTLESREVFLVTRLASELQHLCYFHLDLYETSVTSASYFSQLYYRPEMKSLINSSSGSMQLCSPFIPILADERFSFSLLVLTTLTFTS